MSVFDRVRRNEMTLAELASGLTLADLRRLTNEMVDAVQALIDGCTDDDVVFEPDDPAAYDPAAATDEELHMPWTLGHVIVHITASTEEAAALAAELARGVAFHGRSRYEVPWETIRTIEQCRMRLEESRRIRLASLDMWPDQPHLENTYQPNERIGPLNAISRFLYGLMHSDSHLEHIREIVRQAQAARQPSEGKTVPK